MSVPPEVEWVLKTTWTSSHSRSAHCCLVERTMYMALPKCSYGQSRLGCTDHAVFCVDVSSILHLFLFSHDNSSSILPIFWNFNPMILSTGAWHGIITPPLFLTFYIHIYFQWNFFISLLFHHFSYFNLFVSIFINIKIYLN